MNTEPQDILSLALALPDSERASMAATLIKSLEQGEDQNADAQWAAEIKRRLDSIDNGDVSLVPWDTVMNEMRERRNA